MLPPRLATVLLRILPGREEHESLIGDLSERHAQLAAVHGARHANTFFWRETFDAIRVNATRTRTPGFHPQGDSHVRHWLTDLGYAFRSLRRAPTHLVVCVLTLGLAARVRSCDAGVNNACVAHPADRGTSGALTTVRTMVAPHTS